MKNYYPNNNVLDIPGYEIYFSRFSDSILSGHFPEAISDLKEILNDFYITEEEIISPGGGLSKITQRLRDSLYSKNWLKEVIESVHSVQGIKKVSESHEVDHYKRFREGNIGLEIEWNNKDPFFDRDLSNFRKLHEIGDLSLGIIITRGSSLQEEIPFIYKKVINQTEPYNYENLINRLPNISDTEKRRIKKLLEKDIEYSKERIALNLSSSKYGTATTHMNKLKLRLDRGVGNPCPFVLIGIGKDKLVRSI